MTTIQLVGIGLAVLAAGVVLWWSLRAIRKGHEAGPELRVLKGERDAANDEADRLARPPLTGRQQLRTLRRLLHLKGRR